MSRLVNWIHAQTQGTDQYFVLTDKSSQKFIGLIGIHRIHTQTPEFGLWMREDQHAKGYAKEALKSIYDWAVLNFEADYFVYPVAEQKFCQPKTCRRFGGKHQPYQTTTQIYSDHLSHSCKTENLN